MAGQIVVLATGGTIAGVAADAADHVGYRAGEVPIARLLEGLPALAGVSLTSEQLAQVDSKDMDAQVWRRLAGRCADLLADPGVRGVVVTHGTDTLEETAWFLQRVLAPARPVVLASAMRPSTALSPDGPQNLADAFTVAACPGARGVVAVSAGTVHGAADVRKAHPYRLDAFSSGDAGPLARVEAGAVRMLRRWPDEPAVPGALARAIAAHDWPWVEVVASGALADGRAVRALAAAGVRGLVVAATGNGTLHRDLEAALLQARDGGVRVLRSTRCLEGRIVTGGNDGLPSTPLAPAKARVELMLELLAADGAPR